MKGYYVDIWEEVLSLLNHNPTDPNIIRIYASKKTLSSSTRVSAIYNLKDPYDRAGQIPRRLAYLDTSLCTLGTELRGYSRRNSRIYKPFKFVTLAVL